MSHQGARQQVGIVLRLQRKDTDVRLDDRLLNVTKQRPLREDACHQPPFFFSTVASSKLHMLRKIQVLFAKSVNILMP